MISKSNNLIIGENVNKENIRKVVSSFCQFLMFDAEGNQMKNYKVGLTRYWTVENFYLFDEIITVPRRTFTPTLS